MLSTIVPIVIYDIIFCYDYDYTEAICQHIASVYINRTIGVSHVLCALQLKKAFKHKMFCLHERSRDYYYSYHMYS